jgi:hypothetical protein
VRAARLLPALLAALLLKLPEMPDIVDADGELDEMKSHVGPDACTATCLAKQRDRCDGADGAHPQRIH